MLDDLPIRIDQADGADDLRHTAFPVAPKFEQLGTVVRTALRMDGASVDSPLIEELRACKYMGLLRKAGGRTGEITAELGVWPPSHHDCADEP